MEIIHQPVVVQKWLLEPDEKFNNENLEQGILYEIDLSPQLENDIKYCMLSIVVSKITENYLHGIVFELEVVSAFKIKNKGKSVSPKFIFELMEKSILNFSKIFNDKVKGTTMESFKIPRPLYSIYEQELKLII